MNNAFPKMIGKQFIQDGWNSYRVVKCGECFLLIPASTDVVAVSAEIKLVEKDCRNTVSIVKETFVSNASLHTLSVEPHPSQEFPFVGSNISSAKLFG